MKNNPKLRRLRAKIAKLFKMDEGIQVDSESESGSDSDSESDPDSGPESDPESQTIEEKTQSQGDEQHVGKKRVVVSLLGFLLYGN